VDLYRRELFPHSIEVQMVVVPIRRALRGIYGSNARAVWHMFLWTLDSGVRDWWYLQWLPFWNLKVLCKTQVQWEAELDRKADRIIHGEAKR